MELTLNAAAMGVGDGLITGEVLLRDGVISDPLGADFDWVLHAAAGNECLAATVNNHPGEVLEAEIVTGTGLDVVSEEPTSRSCSPCRECRRRRRRAIAGVATGDAVRVDNDAGDADDPTAVNSVALRSSHAEETDPQLEPSFETNRRRSAGRHRRERRG